MRSKFCQKPPEINARETHRPHDLSIVKKNICSVKTKNPPQYSPSVVLRYQLLMIKRSFDVVLDGSGSLHCVTKGNIVWWAFVVEPISCHKTRLVLALSELRIAEDVS